MSYRKISFPLSYRGDYVIYGLCCVYVIAMRFNPVGMFTQNHNLFYYTWRAFDHSFRNRIRLVTMLNKNIRISYFLPPVLWCSIYSRLYFFLQLMLPPFLKFAEPKASLNSIWAPISLICLSLISEYQQVYRQHTSLQSSIFTRNTLVFRLQFIGFTFSLRL